MFENGEIVAIGYDEKEIRIAYRNVKKLQEYFGVRPIDIGGMSIAGSAKEWLQIETFDGMKFDIPRTQGNDTQILSFLLRWKRP